LNLLAEKIYTVHMNNLIISNAAGAFSTILRYFSWMSVKEINKNSVNVFFDFQNKTDFRGNTYLNYSRASFSSVGRKRENLINHFFINLQSDNFPQNSIFIEQYPFEVTSVIENYPQHLLSYEGRGCNIEQYFNKNELEKVREKFNSHWNNLILSDELNKRIEFEFKSIFSQKSNILCAMVRYSDHYVGEFSYDEIIEQIKLEMVNFDKLLIITQINPLIYKLKDIFGEKCLYFEDRHRVDDYHTDWAGGRNVTMSDLELIKETQDCIIDVLAASKCDFLMGGASNMMLGALSFNKTLDFKIFNVLSNKIGR
jgi:hypothetical protein